MSNLNIETNTQRIHTILKKRMDSDTAWKVAMDIMGGSEAAVRGIDPNDDKRRRKKTTWMVTDCFGIMPNQAFGYIMDMPFYYRARHGKWELRLYHTVGWDITKELPDDEFIYTIITGEHPTAGWDDKGEVYASIGNAIAIYLERKEK